MMISMMSMIANLPQCYQAVQIERGASTLNQELPPFKTLKAPFKQTFVASLSIEEQKTLSDHSLIIPQTEES